MQKRKLVLVPCLGSAGQACSHGWNKADLPFRSTQYILFDLLLPGAEPLRHEKWYF